MDFQFQKLCQVEKRRLLLVMGIIVSVVLVLQSYTLPYGNVLLSLFPSSKVSELGKRPSVGDSTPKSVMDDNLTLLNDSYSNDSSMILGALNNTEVSYMWKQNEHNNDMQEKDRDSKNDFGSEDISPYNDFVPEKDGNLGNESSFGKVVALDKNSTLENVKNLNNDTVEKARESENGVSLGKVKRSDGDFSLSDVQNANRSLTLDKIGSPAFASQPPTLPPVISPNNMTMLRKSDANSSNSVVSVASNISSVGKQATEMFSKDENPGLLNLTTLKNNSTFAMNPLIKKGWMPTISLSKMNSLLLQSRVSSYSMRPQWSSVCDLELLSAKSQIENAPIITNDQKLYPSLFRNVSMFKRSYELMERMLKVYIYREGDEPIFHQPTDPILRGIYASEGWFMRQMEGNKHFVVKDPRKAHLFYLPFSSRMLQLTLYVRNSHIRQNLAEFLKDYVDMIAAKYPFWNRTRGSDHFFVACHDWAPFETRHHMDNCIKVLCNANAAKDFKIGKDVTLPETYVHMVENPLKNLGGKPPSERPILAFFAGGMHGYLRPILLKYWENKDPDMKIFGQMPHVYNGTMTYAQHMKSSKYCICARGYEVNSPRIVEAIFYECVPVFISDNYVPPFFEVLNWEAFSVFILEKDIPNLKNILLSIPEDRYRRMQLRVKKVQQHFLWHINPKKYDNFHMILHSVWFNRLNQIQLQ